MRNDVYGQIIFSENDLCDLYLKDPEKTFNRFLSEEQIQFTDNLNLSTVPDITLYTDPKVSVAEFDNKNQNNWHMPQQYKDMDIAQFVLEQCQDDSELQRAGMELLLFQERGMFDLLKYLKYLLWILPDLNFETLMKAKMDDNSVCAKHNITNNTLAAIKAWITMGK